MHVDELAPPADVEGPVPLVVALHGRGGLPALPSLARVRGPVRVWVPHGPHALAGGRAWSPISVTSGRLDALAADLAAVASELDARLARTEHGGTPIVVGHSQGAMLALALAARGTHRLELVLGAAFVPPSLEPSIRSGAIAHLRAAHGEADAIVPLAPTARLFERLRTRGVDALLHTFPGVGHEGSPAMQATLDDWLAEAVDRARDPGIVRAEVRGVIDILLGPDVFVNASVAAGTPPEHIARRLLGKPGAKPKSTRWVMTWTRALLGKAPGFKHEAVEAQMKTIEGLLDIVELQEKTPEGDWVKGLVASAKAAGLKRVVTDHPDLADKTEVDGISFLSSEAWLVEQTTPPPPPPPKKK